MSSLIRVSKAGISSGNVSYSTTFGATENPISEGGKWVHLNPYFSTARTNGGLAYGNNPNPNPGNTFADANVYLGGVAFGPNCRVEATVNKGTTGGYMEVELLLRWTDGYNAGNSEGFTRGYECFLHQSGLYATCAKYAGTPLTGTATIDYFDFLADIPNVQAPVDGDTFWAQIVGNTITCGIIHLGVNTDYFSVDITSGGRTAITSGSPGMGFQVGGSGAETANDQFCFKDYSAVTL
jgi:hypothetical protein